MAFPSDISPSGRSYSSGNYPSKAYNAQDGAEVRILYGNKRIGASLQLVYNNLTDTTAQLFLDHYDEMKGTFTQFSVSGNALRAVGLQVEFGESLQSHVMTSILANKVISINWNKPRSTSSHLE